MVCISKFLVDFSCNKQLLGVCQYLSFRHTYSIPLLIVTFCFSCAAWESDGRQVSHRFIRKSDKFIKKDKLSWCGMLYEADECELTHRKLYCCVCHIKIIEVAETNKKERSVDLSMLPLLVKSNKTSFLSFL